MAEEIKLKKSKECMHCVNLFKCKGAKDVSKCVNYMPRREEKNDISATIEASKRS